MKETTGSFTKIWVGFSGREKPSTTPGFGLRDGNGHGPAVNYTPIFRSLTATGCITSKARSTPFVFLTTAKVSGFSQNEKSVLYFFRMKFSRIASRIFHVFVLMKAVTLLGDVPMPHSGHIAVEGTPYWGNGYFKFAIIDENEKALWTHDNSQKIPPTDHMSLEVKNGFYSLYLGDESVTGMKALPASSLLSSERIFLRVWFSKKRGRF